MLLGVIIGYVLAMASASEGERRGRRDLPR